jgi:glutathione synthase/RimK-type ligase-like ATP-grasp enzyme
MSVLIVTNKIDPHSDAVISILNGRGVDCFRLNTEDIFTKFSTKLSIDEHGISGSFWSEMRSIDLSAIRSVLYRRPQKPTFDNITDLHEQQFARSESSAFLNWLWESLQCTWINKPSLNHIAGSKIDQLRLAAEIGFNIPRTIITNDPKTARSFYEECNGKVINKVLTTGLVEDGKEALTIYTHRVEKEHLEHLDLIKNIPCVFQERVEKKIELRITVVGDKVFPAEIHSQNNQSTKDDWRRYDLPNTPHMVHHLPQGITSLCLKLVHSYGLSFGAIDMILTPDDEYVFLEINPNGQWLWIEQLTGLQISSAIADMLAQGSS